MAIIINSEEFQNINIEYFIRNKINIEKTLTLDKKVNGMYQEYREDVERTENIKEIDIDNNFSLV